MTNETISVYSPAGEEIAAAVIGALGFLLNSTALIVLLRNFTKIFSHAEACFVANLAFADMLTGLGALLWGVYSDSQYPKSVTDALLCFSWTTVSVSFLTLFCMASERLFVVTRPVKAQRLFKKPFAYVCCGLVWFVSVLTGSMIAVNRSIAFCVMIVMFEVSLIATISCYVGIFFTVRRLRRNSHKSAARYSAKNAKVNVDMEENESALHHRVTVRQESRVTNLVFVLVVILAITVFPYMVVLQVNVAYKLSCPHCSVRKTLINVANYMFPIEIVNFVLNPIVYAWWLPKFRQASRKTFRPLICCKKLRDPAGVDVRAEEYSSESDSLGNGPATIFTGQDSPLNNNIHS